MAIQRDKIIASAEKLVAKGKVEGAIKEYERLLEENPNDVNTLNRIGDLWVRINRNDEGVRAFSKIADHYSKDGFFLKAIAIYKKINKLDPSKLDVYAKLADLYAKQGLAMEAKSQYQVLADYYLKHGDPANALATYRKISELDPNSINVHVKLADLYSQNGQTAEALKEYDRVGRMLLKRGMLDEAVQVFRKALKIDASNVDLVESLITALHDAKDYDNAIQILETSLEKNKENPRLLAWWAKSYLGKGDVASARGVLERGLKSNPADNHLREALGDVYLRQNDPDRAVELLLPAVDAAIARNDGKAAVEILQKILRADANNVGAHTKLVSVYTKLREETNVVTAMNGLAEAHLAHKSYAEAAQTLNELIRREPQNAQYKNKLALVQQHLGGAPAAPSAPPPPPLSLPEMDFVEPAMPELDMSLELDASEPMELDFGSLPPEPEPPPQPQPVASAPTPASAVEEEEEEDLDFITEHLTEAEVFAKYGLSEKAIEHLRVVIDRAPKHAPAYERLVRVYMDEGDSDNVRKYGDQYIALQRGRGEYDAATALEQELVTRGFIEAAPVPSAPPATDSYSEMLEVDEISPAVESYISPVGGDLEPAPEELDLDMTPSPEETELEFDIESMQDEFAAPVEETPIVSAPVEPLPEETFEISPSMELPSLDLTPEPEPAAPQLDFTVDEPAASNFTIEEPPPEFSLEEPAASIDFSTGIEPSASTGDAAAYQPDFGSMIAPSPAPEELGEIDFYIEQELFEEATARVAALATRFPGSTDVAERQARINQASAAAAAAAVPPPPPPRAAAPPPPQAFSTADIENELMSAIPDDEDDIKIVAPRASAPHPVVEDEGNLFADEDDFFDLAAELEEELEEDAANVSLSEEEQSLEEIFKEFKKGVESQLDSEDYDTHYNLGIAYKEMGLIDEAIGEFQLASKDPKRTIECCSMLGLCFLEKGMPQLAVKWYSKGLEVPEITEDEHLGLTYDLANSYLETGDAASAHKHFIEIYGTRSSYRDVRDRIKQIEEGGLAARQ